MEPEIKVGQARRIPSRSEFGRRRDLSAGSIGMKFTPSQLKTFFGNRGSNENVRFPLCELNSCLSPQISDVRCKDFIYYNIENVIGIIEDKGVISITFFLGYSKSDQNNPSDQINQSNPSDQCCKCCNCCKCSALKQPGKSFFRDVIFSVQYKNKECFYSSDNSSNAPLTMLKASQFTAPPADVCRPIAIAHNISPNVFQQYLDGFWQNIPVPPPSVITWDNFTLLLSNPQGKKYMVLTWQDNDKNSNDLDISFNNNPDVTFTEAFTSNKTLEIRVAFKETERNIATAMADSMFKDIDTEYSIHLFYGIHYLKTNDVVQDPKLAEYRLYKGRTPQQELTILVEAVYFDGSRQYFDLSNERP